MITFNTTKKTITFERLSDAVEFVRQYAGDDRTPTKAKKASKKLGRRKKEQLREWQHEVFRNQLPSRGIVRIVFDKIVNSPVPIMSSDITNQTKISDARVNRAVSFLYKNGAIKRTVKRYPSKRAKRKSSYYMISDAAKKYVSMEEGQ